MNFKKKFIEKFNMKSEFKPTFDKIKDKINVEQYVQQNEIINGNKNKRKLKLAFILVPIVLVALVIATTIGLINLGSANIPTYNGMSIARTEVVNRMARRVDIGDKDDHSGHQDEVENNIEDIVDIEIKTDDGAKYYVRQNETFIIQIHLSNPKQYEIQSFTLNGEKYANYMFKEGSTMELLLLEVTAPNTSGYIEYTIDAIKYIDGTEIKDVRMKGDKTIKAGVAFENAPTAKIVSKEISATYINLDIEVEDKDSVIGDNPLDLYLTDGKEVIDVKDLKVGSNSVTFNNLKTSTLYEYGVVTAYDLVDGNDLHSEWLLIEDFTTLGAFEITNVNVEKEAITFDIEQIVEEGTITGITLYDANTNELVGKGDVNTRKFEGLLSNHEYNLYIDFTYKSDINEFSDWCMQSITTEAYTTPEIRIIEISSTDVAIEGTYEMIDRDGIGTIHTVKLFKDGNFVAENAEKEIKFTSLDYYTNYLVEIEYSYDLNDGNGVIYNTFEYEFTTSPHLEFINCSVLNSSEINEGDTIYIQAHIDNPNKAMPTRVIVNGQEYSCAGSTPNMIILNIVNNGQFDGGMTDLYIEEVYMELAGKEYKVIATVNNVCSIYIIGKFELLSLDYVNSDFEVIGWRFPSDVVYVMLTLNNKSGYEITKITLSNNEIIKPMKVDDEHWYFPYNEQRCLLLTIEYENKYKKDSIDLWVSASIFILESDEIKKISTPNDLLNMNDGYYYELQNNIDLKGLDWSCPEFNGVFDGKGYSIKNMTKLKTVDKYNSAYIGLFSRATGYLLNLNMEGILVIIDKKVDVSDSDISIRYGSIVAVGSNLTIEKCTVSSDSYISLCSGFAGGILGESETFNDVYVIECTNYANILGENTNINGIAYTGSAIKCTNYGNLSSGNGSIGGIIGSNLATVIDCINYGNLSNTNGSIGGIVSDNTANIDNCVNHGSVTSINGNAGGIAGSSSNPNMIGIITNCTNNGTVSSDSGYAGGIVGNNEKFILATSIVNCINNGDVTSIDGTAGAISGYNCGTIEGCKNYGTISGKIVSDDGLVGNNEGTIKDSFNYGKVN